jgi:lipopolysaccharide/colanic/teichoic acid biosynthesis glycosyltransferase
MRILGVSATPKKSAASEPTTRPRQIGSRGDLAWDASVRLDLRYVENCLLTLDLMILWKTAFRCVSWLRQTGSPL